MAVFSRFDVSFCVDYHPEYVRDILSGEPRVPSLVRD